MQRDDIAPVEVRAHAALRRSKDSPGYAEAFLEPERRMPRLGALLLPTVGMAVAFSSACVDDDPSTPPSTSAMFSVSSIADDQLQENPVMMEIARVVPEFGGVFFDDNGRLIVAMTDLAKSSAVEVALRPLLGTHETKAGMRAGYSVQVVTKPVQYSFLELARYKAALRRAFGIEGVTTLDANEERNRVEIGIADPSVVSRVRRLADSLGIPAEALSFRVAGYAESDAEITGSTSAVYGQTVVEGGWRISNPSAGECTLGMSAIRGTNGDSVFVTNSHCTSSYWGYDGDTVRQPDLYSTVIGEEILDPAPGSCNWGLSECRASDAALFTAYRPIRFGSIVRLEDSVSCGSCSSSLVVDSDQPSLTITSTLSYVVSNETIHKVGKVTGWTYGSVTATCVDVSVPIWPFDDEVLCSDKVDYSRSGGDSGGPVFSLVSGTNIQLRGIHFGHDPISGDGYMSNLGQIATDLGHLTYYDRGAPSVAIDGPTEVPGGGIWCEWQSNVTNGIPPYTYSWSGLLSGSSGAVSGPIYSSGTLYVTVTDFWGRQGSSSIDVSVEMLPPFCE